MSEKIFGLTETGELINNETGRVYCVKGISALDLQDILNRLIKENKELKEHQDINCQNCQYFVSDSASFDCLKREDIGYKGTCIDGMDLHMLAKNCPYY